VSDNPCDSPAAVATNSKPPLSGSAADVTATSAVTAADRRRQRWFGPHGLVASYTGVALLVLMFIGFSVGLRGTFLTYSNLTAVASSMSLTGIMALGVMVPLAAGVFDVSISGTMTVACTAVVELFLGTNGKMPIPVAIVLVLLGGAAVGVLNGFLVVRERLDSFIVTIGMSSVLLGLSERISNGSTLTAQNPTGFLTVGRTTFGGIPITAVYLVAVAIIIWYVLAYTPVGRRISATGAGREAARLSGVRTDRIIFGAFMASGVVAAFAGVVYAAQLGSAPPDVGSPYLLPAFSAAFLGSTIIHPGRFNVPGLIIAMLIVEVGINGLQLAGISFWIVDLFQGAALIIAIVLARRAQGRS
jgi:ribose transport system permease protein